MIDRSAYAVLMTPFFETPTVAVTAAAGVTFATPAMLCMEGSGTGPASVPIEVGFVLPDGSGYCTLIRPLAGWTHWDVKAERVHRIARETTVAHGRAVAEVAAQLNLRLAGRTLYCEAWAQADGWLRLLFAAAGTAPAFQLENLRALLSSREAAVWPVLQRQVAGEMRLQRHRASADAKILQLTLVRLRGPLPEPPR